MSGALAPTRTVGRLLVCIIHLGVSLLPIHTGMPDPLPRSLLLSRFGLVLFVCRWPLGVVSFFLASGFFFPPFLYLAPPHIALILLCCRDLRRLPVCMKVL